MPTNTTGSKIIWFLLTSLTAIILAMAGAWAMDARAVDNENRKAVEAVKDDLNTHERMTAEHLARLDAKLDVVLQRLGVDPSVINKQK